MRRRELLRALARVTHEPITRLKRMGFQLVTPDEDDGYGHHAAIAVAPSPPQARAGRVPGCTTDLGGWGRWSISNYYINILTVI